MRKLFIAASLLILVACETKTESTPPAPAPTLSDLALYLEGDFSLNRIYYQGDLRSVLGTQPIGGFGDSAQGYYHFLVREDSIDYAINTFLQIEVLGSQVDLPLVVGDQTDLVFTGDSTFTINDGQLGLMSYKVLEQWADSCLLQTTYQDDTAGFNIDLQLDIYLHRN